ncbi:hypothetical protein AC781_00740 [Akkermansia glycaniphila]|nr:hypothetical protein AC781_00740 [Akkermansia glycaniphila]
MRPHVNLERFRPQKTGCSLPPASLRTINDALFRRIIVGNRENRQPKLPSINKGKYPARNSASNQGRTGTDTPASPATQQAIIPEHTQNIEPLHHISYA